MAESHRVERAVRPGGELAGRLAAGVAVLARDQQDAAGARRDL
jgi:hypothetical protein